MVLHQKLRSECMKIIFNGMFIESWYYFRGEPQQYTVDWAPLLHRPLFNSRFVQNKWLRK
jgi:hypothetical protein